MVRGGHREVADHLENAVRRVEPGEVAGALDHLEPSRRPGGRPSRISSAAAAIRGSFEPTHTSVGLVIFAKLGQEIQLHQKLAAAAVDVGVLDPPSELLSLSTCGPKAANTRSPSSSVISSPA